MDIQAEKIDLLQTIINTTDEGVIMDMKTIIAQRDSDWFDELSSAQQEDVLEGLAQADAGNTVSHDDVVKMFGKWGLK